MYLRSSKGFTLIELTIAIVIIMIMTLLGIRLYKGQLYKSKVSNTVILSMSWAKAMQEWKVQNNANDFTFLDNIAAADRKKAFGYYAFSLDNNRNPWGKKGANFYTINLTTDTCLQTLGLVSSNSPVCGVLEIETPSETSAEVVARAINEKAGLLDATATHQGEGVSAPTVITDIQKTDPATGETYYLSFFAVFSSGDTTVRVYVL